MLQLYYRDIVELNKDFKDDLPNKDIKVLIRDGDSGTTSAFTNGLSFYDSDWKSSYGRFSSWPSQLAKKFKKTLGTIGITPCCTEHHLHLLRPWFVDCEIIGMYSALSSEKYSLGYISYSAIAQSGLIPIVAFKHDGGTVHFYSLPLL